jgi:hypothetical protein
MKDIIVVFIAVIAMALAARGLLWIYYDASGVENTTVTYVSQNVEK